MGGMNNLKLSYMDQKKRTEVEEANFDNLQVVIGGVAVFLAVEEACSDNLEVAIGGVPVFLATTESHFDDSEAWNACWGE